MSSDGSADASNSAEEGHQQDKQTNLSPYRGVTWDNRHSGWRVRIYYRGKQRHVGRFAEEVEAAKAYDKAAVYFYGRNAATNFGFEACQADTSEVRHCVMLAKSAAKPSYSHQATVSSMCPKDQYSHRLPASSASGWARRSCDIAHQPAPGVPIRTCNRDRGQCQALNPLPGFEVSQQPLANSSRMPPQQFCRSSFIHPQPQQQLLQDARRTAVPVLQQQPQQQQVTPAGSCQSSRAVLGNSIFLGSADPHVLDMRDLGPGALEALQSPNTSGEFVSYTGIPGAVGAPIVVQFIQEPTVPQQLPAAPFLQQTVDAEALQQMRTWSFTSQQSASRLGTGSPVCGSMGSASAAGNGMLCDLFGREAPVTQQQLRAPLFLQQQQQQQLESSQICGQATQDSSDLIFVSAAQVRKWQQQEQLLQIQQQFDQQQQQQQQSKRPMSSPTGVLNSQGAARLLLESGLAGLTSHNVQQEAHVLQESQSKCRIGGNLLDGLKVLQLQPTQQDSPMHGLGPPTPDSSGLCQQQLVQGFAGLDGHCGASVMQMQQLGVQYA